MIQHLMSIPTGKNVKKLLQSYLKNDDQRND
jgi:hypothetical protein